MIPNKEKHMTKTDFDILHREMYQVFKGVSNCTLLQNTFTDFEKDYQEIKRYAETYNLKCVFYIHDNQYKCYIYRYDFQRLLIDFIEHDYKSPQSQFISDYIKSKLFSYSDKSFSDFTQNFYVINRKLTIPQADIVKQ